MSRQIRKGQKLPIDRLGEAILITQWLPKHLGRALQPNEAQVFGRMALDAWRHRYGPHSEPYTVRVGEDSSQKTAYMPEHLPVLEEALARYRKCKSYKRIKEE